MSQLPCGGERRACKNGLSSSSTKVVPGIRPEDWDPTQVPLCLALSWMMGRADGSSGLHGRLVTDCLFPLLSWRLWTGGHAWPVEAEGTKAFALKVRLYTLCEE